MNAELGKPRIPDSTFRMVLVLIAVGLYFGPPTFRRTIPPRGQFVALAESFLEGGLSFTIEPGSTLRVSELIAAPTPNHFYCAYPPLPAVLLMPFVWLLGTTVTVEAFTRSISVAVVVLIDLVLDRLPQRMRLPPLPQSTRVVLTAGFAFGTTIWTNADIGMDWHLAHVVALSAMLLALREYAGANRSWLVGVYIGLSVLSRPTTLLTCLFFALEAIRRRELARLIGLSIGPLAAIGLLAAYNQARFNSPWDFAYDRMLLTGEGARLMEMHGQFSIAYVGRNLFWFFAAPPWLIEPHRFPWIGFDPRGLSLFIASPIFLPALYAVFRKLREPVVRSAGISAVLALVPLLLYFNTGYWQFGHRFSMDYWPMLLVLTLIGIRALSRTTVFALAAASLTIHCIGVIWVPVARLPIE